MIQNQNSQNTAPERSLNEQLMSSTMASRTLRMDDVSEDDDDDDPPASNSMSRSPSPFSTGTSLTSVDSVDSAGSLRHYAWF